jgi:hypothetical protein
MVDEPDDIDLDLLRERLFKQAERGEITGKQAEEAAAAHGLKPFEGTPEPPRFDPRLKSHWSIGMAVAWIAWRDFNLVREQDPEFCLECFHWRYREWKERVHKAAKPVKRAGYFLEARRPPTVRRLALLDLISRVRGNVPSTAVMMIREAEAELWRALSEGYLIAEGFNADGAVVEIASREWAYLRLREAGGRDVLRYDAVGQSEPFTAVTIRQSDALRLWPAISEFPVLPAAVIEKGRPAFGKRARSSPQLDHTNEVLRNEFPNGVPTDLTNKEIRRLIRPVFKEKGWKLSSIDTIARARGWRRVG